MKYSNTIKKIGQMILVLVVFLTPLLARAAIFVPIVPECKGESGNGECGWADLVAMGQNVINDGVYLVAICAVVSITYAGYLYITSGGSDGQIKKAHEIFTKVIWGIFITLGAWIIVHEILKYLGVSSTWSMLQ